VLTLCGWEGNRRFGIAQAMHYRWEWSNHVRVQSPLQADEPPSYAQMEYGILFIIIYSYYDGQHHSIFLACN